MAPSFPSPTSPYALFPQRRPKPSTSGTTAPIHLPFMTTGTILMTPHRLRHPNNNNDCRAQARAHQQWPQRRPHANGTAVAAVGAALSRSASGIFLPPVGGNSGMSSLPNANTLFRVPPPSACAFLWACQTSSLIPYHHDDARGARSGVQ